MVVTNTCSPHRNAGKARHIYVQLFGMDQAYTSSVHDLCRTNQYEMFSTSDSYHKLASHTFSLFFRVAQLGVFTLSDSKSCGMTLNIRPARCLYGITPWDMIHTQPSREVDPYALFTVTPLNAPINILLYSSGSSTI